jgi:hypothetical protein
VARGNQAAKLLREMLALGVSRYDPDPLTAQVESYCVRRKSDL